MNRFYFRLCLPFLALVLPLPLSALPPPAELSPDKAATENPAIAEPGFAGSWLWAVGDKRFRLILAQKDDVLTGFHSVEIEGGGKRDAVDGGNQLPSINGRVSGTTTVVRFKSGIPGSQAYGHARVTLRGRYLYWELMDSTGESYFPDHAVLVRQEK